MRSSDGLEVRIGLRNRTKLWLWDDLSGLCGHLRDGYLWANRFLGYHLSNG